MATSHYYYTLNAIIKDLFKELNNLNNSLIEIYEKKDLSSKDFDNLYTMSSLVEDSLTHLKSLSKQLK